MKINVNRKRKTLGNVLIAIGSVIVIAGAVIFLGVMIDEHNAEEKSTAAVQKLEDYFSEHENSASEEKRESQISAETDSAHEDPILRIDGFNYLGYIELCRYNLKMPVIADWDLDYLQVAPARYRGSLQGCDLVIAAHNYRAHFNSLRYSDPGDKIIFTDVRGKQYNYIIKEIEELQPTEIERMINGEWDLTLFTCNYDGSARVTARCVQADTNADSNTN